MAARRVARVVAQVKCRENSSHTRSNIIRGGRSRSLHRNAQVNTAATNAFPEISDSWSEHVYDQDSYRKVDLTFENAIEAYKSKSTFELARALLVYKLCGNDLIVSKNKELMKFARKALGARLFKLLMKSTFYGQFVAGENEDDIRPVLEKNRAFGVKSILDYSVEMDLTHEQAKKAEMESCVSEAQPDNLQHSPANIQYRCHEEFGDRRDLVASARTYFYKDEAGCDVNMHNFLRGIDTVCGTTQRTGFAAIKLTALGRPQLLLQMSEVLVRIRRFIEHAGMMDQKDIEKQLKSYSIGRAQRKQWYTILDTSKNGEIDLLSWNNLMRYNSSMEEIMQVPNLKTGKMEPLITALTDEEEFQMKNMLHRINTIAEYAMRKDSRVMIDAEQSYFTPAINRLAMEMMRKFNKEKAIIFNTYQCYLKDAHNLITTDLAMSRREEFFFGAKLVRGAYMEQERLRAETLGYEDPINPTFEATTAMYEKVLSEVMEQMKERPKGKIAAMVASHNEDTVRFTVNKMKEYNIHPQDKVLCFGQLLGMCDQVSFSLGQAGYSVYKYVPYGPVEEVLPYLSRRAQENAGIMKNTAKERRLLKTEIFRRIREGPLFKKVEIPPLPPHV